MIARHRGEHDRHRPLWRPTMRPPTPAAPMHPTDADTRAVLSHTITRPGLGDLRSHLRRAVRWLVAVLTAVAAYLVIGAGLAELLAPPAHSRLPATPRAWLDSYEAAAVDNPGRVCAELFAPQLAQAYGNAMHGSCISYFRRITSYSVSVRRVLQDGGTAVLELRQTVRPRDWAVVLSHRRAGWQAVDLLSGDLAW